jgi:hypothetical protein
VARISNSSTDGEALARLHGRESGRARGLIWAGLLWCIGPASARWSEVTGGWIIVGGVTRYDWYTESYVAFLIIARFMVALTRILHRESWDWSLIQIV